VDRIAGVILAGGRASRLGGEKPLLPFADGVLIDAVIARARPQVTQLALCIPQQQAGTYRERYGDSIPLLFDVFDDDIGPLNGVLSGLEWLRSVQDAKWLATFPCDTPFLPADAVEQLWGSSTPGSPVAAEDLERLQGLFALWPLECADRLRAGLESGRLRSIQSALEAFGGRRHRFDNAADAFFNVNTKADLEIAQKIAATRSARWP
jgi:molybdopterin-guanine dinucleotide biosynthesis protein A